MVSIKPLILERYSPPTIAWWAQVTVTLEANSRIVLRRGIPQGSKTASLRAGNSPPTTLSGP